MSETSIQPDLSGHLVQGAHRIWWEYFGNPESTEREVVVLLNGLAMHTQAWYGLLGELRPTYDVLLYDYLGQGQSSCPDEPYSIPDFACYLAAILDELGVERIHLMGISYGGFIALDFARLFGERLNTLTLSGILLSPERQFAMYQDMSLRFYRAAETSDEAFDLYTHYLYEKIFGEEFLCNLPDGALETMRSRFAERYRDRVYCLVRLTEAQNPFFEQLAERLPEYRAIGAPTLIVAGGEDRAIPVWQQRKLQDVLPDTRMILLKGAGHVVYLEKRDAFFGLLRAFMAARRTDFESPPTSSAEES